MRLTDRKWKATLLNYDWIAQQTGEQCYCLSNRTVQMLLTISNTLAWATRWTGNEFFTDEQREQIFNWANECEAELMNGCCGGAGQTVRTRINAEGRVEVSVDGGVTWTQDDSYDPRSTNTIYEPIKTDGTTDENACAAANAFDENLQETKANIISALGTYTNAAGLSAALVPIVATYVGVPVAGAVVALAAFTIGLAGVAISQTAIVIDDALDEPYFEFMKCQYLCVIGDSEATWEHLDTIQNALFEEYGLATPENACKVLLTIAIFKAVGPVGVTNMGRVGTGTGDCEECNCPVEWCVNFNFAISQYGWTAYNGVWVGDGFENTTPVFGGTQYRAVGELLFDLPVGSRMTAITMYFEGDGRGENAVNEVAGEATEGQIPNLAEEVNDVIKTGFLTADLTSLDWDGGARAYAGVDGHTMNSVKLTRVWIAGTGTLPDGWEAYPTDCV